MSSICYFSPNFAWKRSACREKGGTPESKRNKTFKRVASRHFLSTVECQLTRIKYVVYCNRFQVAHGTQWTTKMWVEKKIARNTLCFGYSTRLKKRRSWFLLIFYPILQMWSRDCCFTCDGPQTDRFSLCFVTCSGRKKYMALLLITRLVVLSILLNPMQQC